MYHYVDHCIVQYCLKGIIYFADEHHFISRIINNEGFVFVHNGMVSGGLLAFDAEILIMLIFVYAGEAKHLWLYMCTLWLNPDL
jgi:hypothetical protein